MTDVMIKDLIALTIILTYIGLLAFNHPVDPKLEALAMAAFGFLFKGTTSWSLSNPFKKAVPVIALFLLLGAGNARADIFNPIPHTAKAEAFLSSVNGTSTNAGNILADATTIINYLGVKEGEAYNFNQHKFVTTTGATLISYTPWNLALDVDMINTDGVIGAVSWNVGNFLPVQNVPVMQYTQYLYLYAGAGAEERNEPDGSTPMKFASVVGAEFKFSFGASN